MENLFTLETASFAEKELEDTPPLSFNANGQPLLDWRLDGASGGVGDRTENLFDIEEPNIYKGYYSSNKLVNASSNKNAFVYIEIEEGKTYYVTGIKRYNSSAKIRWATTERRPANGVECIRTDEITQPNGMTLTANSGENYFALFVCGDSDYNAYSSVEAAVAANCEDLVIDNGYVIPITCGGETNTIYLDAQLGASDSINMTDTGISIPTVDGLNTLSVGTVAQPSSVYIKYKEGGDEMVTLAKIGGRYNTALLEIRGLSTDTKPTTEIEGMTVTNGSTYIEIDTGDTYMFDAENGVWHNITG